MGYIWPLKRFSFAQEREQLVATFWMASILVSRPAACKTALRDIA
jgi:hypothetical protein